MARRALELHGDGVRLRGENRNRPADDGLRFTNHGRLFTEEKRHRRHTDRVGRRSKALKSRFLANTPRQVLAWQTITMAAPWWSLSHRNRPTNRCSVLLGMGENYRSCTAGDGVTGTIAVSMQRAMLRSTLLRLCSRRKAHSPIHRIATGWGVLSLVPLAHNYAVELRYGERSPRRCPVL